MKTASIVAVLLFALDAHAEPIAQLAHAREVSLDLGFDGAVVGRLGFATAIAGERRGLVVWTDATIPAGGLDVDDFRARVGARVDVYRRGHWYVRGGLAAVVRATKSTGMQAESFATELALAPGVTAGRWTAELELGLEQAWLTRIAPTPAYRDLVYMAEGGWYRSTARDLRAGVGAAVRLGDIDVVVRAGWSYTGALDYLPALYAVTGLAYRF